MNNLKAKTSHLKIKEIRQHLGLEYIAAKKFPDLTGDGKVTRADVLKGRGVFASGGKVKDKGAFETESKRQKQKRKKIVKNQQIDPPLKKLKKRKSKHSKIKL